ncbi:MAG: hypothetical protein ACKO5E_03970 [bacterium]
MEMIFDFFSLGQITPANLKLLQNTPPRLFEKEVNKYRTLGEDKRRDAAIAIFDRYLSVGADPANSIRDILLERNQQGEIGRIEEICENGRLLKQQRDQKYGGFSLIKRIQRHNTKNEGFLAGATPNLFDNIVNEAKQIASLEFINNPRGMMDGMYYDSNTLIRPNQTLDDLGFEQINLDYGITAETLGWYLDQRGPVISQRSISVYGYRSGHYIIIIGRRFSGGISEFLYHDPFSGSNMAQEEGTVAGWLDPGDFLIVRKDDQNNQNYVRQRRI